MIGEANPISHNLELRARIEHFYVQEANMLDDRQFDEWLDLLADDIHYWMPLRSYRRVGAASATMSPEHEFSKPQEISLFDEVKASLTIRVKRLKTGKAWAEEPASRTRRLVSNFSPTLLADGQFRVLSNFALFLGRAGGEPTTYYGRRDDVLRDTEDGLRLSRRHILLDNELHRGNLSIFF